MKLTRKEFITRLVVSALFIAIATVLSEIKPFPQHFGGGITPVSMLPIVLIPILYGTGWGFFCSGIYAVMQCLFGLDTAFGSALSPIAVIGCLLLDYFLAYFCLGLVGLFRKGNVAVITAGVAVSIVARFLCSVLSGLTVWGEYIWMTGVTFFQGVWAAMIPNLYILIEAVTTSIVIAVLLQNKSFHKIIGK